jgi:beta-lactamase regulating signal transducer with metallopeptidase domain
MAALFEAVLDMSVKACLVIAVIMVARIILRRAPKKHSYLLWIAAAFRLCVPFSVASKVSIFGIFKENTGESVITDPIPNAFPVPDGIIDTETGDAITNAVGNTVKGGDMLSLTEILACIWLLGVIVMLIYGIFSYLIVYKRMSTATRYEKNVFCSENVLSPFTLGFIKPRIYIPYGLDDVTREKVIQHEKCHISRFDHIIKPFAFILLAFHWFNPLCWLVYDLFTAAYGNFILHVIVFSTTLLAILRRDLKQKN